MEFIRNNQPLIFLFALLLILGAWKFGTEGLME